MYRYDYSMKRAIKDRSSMYIKEITKGLYYIQKDRSGSYADSPFVSTEKVVTFLNYGGFTALETIEGAIITNNNVENTHVEANDANKPF